MWFEYLLGRYGWKGYQSTKYVLTESNEPVLLDRQSCETERDVSRLILSGEHDGIRAQRDAALFPWYMVAAAVIFVLSTSLRIHTIWTFDSVCTSVMETWSMVKPEYTSFEQQLTQLTTTGPISHLVQYEWRQFDFEACDARFCGSPTQDRDDHWKNTWDCETETSMVHAFCNLTY
jgi:hypothetical protein